MAAQTNLRAAQRKASRSVLVAACIQPGHTSSIIKNTLFVVLYTVIAYSIAGHVRLAGAVLRPAKALRSGLQFAKRQLSLHFEFEGKNMASRSPRHTFDMYFRGTVEKDAFMVRLKSIERLTPRGQTQLSYHDLMLAMFDLVVGQATPPMTAADTTVRSNANGKQILS